MSRLLLPVQRRVRRARAAGDAGARGRQQPPRLRPVRRGARVARCRPLHLRHVPVLRPRVYALGDSRTPAIIAGASALVGAAVMVVGGLTFDSDTAKVAVLGLGHSVAYLDRHAGARLRAAPPHRPRLLPTRVPALAGGVGRARAGSPGWSKTASRRRSVVADVLVLAVIGLRGRRALRAPAPHPAQAGRPAGSRVRAGRSRSRGRTVIRRAASVVALGVVAAIALAGCVATGACGALRRNLTTRRCSGCS